MFEQFTACVKVVWNEANARREKLEHEFISPEHLLYALMHTGRECCAAHLLQNNEKWPDDVLKKLSECCERRSSDVFAKQEVEKRIADLALEEMRALEHALVNTGHLLLALIRMEGSIATQALSESHGRLFDLPSLRIALRESMKLRQADSRVPKRMMSPSSVSIWTPRRASDDSTLTQHEEIMQRFQEEIRGLNITSITINTAP